MLHAFEMPSEKSLKRLCPTHPPLPCPSSECKLQYVTLGHTNTNLNTEKSATSAWMILALNPFPVQTSPPPLIIVIVCCMLCCVWCVLCCVFAMCALFVLFCLLVAWLSRRRRARARNLCRSRAAHAAWRFDDQTPSRTEPPNLALRVPTSHTHTHTHMSIAHTSYISHQLICEYMKLVRDCGTIKIWTRVWVRAALCERGLLEKKKLSNCC